MPTPAAYRRAFFSPARTVSFRRRIGWQPSPFSAAIQSARHGSSSLPVSKRLSASALSPASPSTCTRTTYALRGLSAASSTVPVMSSSALSRTASTASGASASESSMRMALGFLLSVSVTLNETVNGDSAKPIGSCTPLNLICVIFMVLLLISVLIIPLQRGQTDPPDLCSFSDTAAVTCHRSCGTRGRSGQTNDSREPQRSH